MSCQMISLAQVIYLQSLWLKKNHTHTHTPPAKIPFCPYFLMICGRYPKTQSLLHGQHITNCYSNCQHAVSSMQFLLNKCKKVPLAEEQGASCWPCGSSTPVHAKELSHRRLHTADLQPVTEPCLRSGSSRTSSSHFKSED